jgi:hypothetical protein
MSAMKVNTPFLGLWIFFICLFISSAHEGAATEKNIKIYLYSQLCACCIIDTILHAVVYAVKYEPF